MKSWVFALIFSTLLGNMSAHQVQMVTSHEKTNGVLLRIVVNNIPNVKNIAGWIGQENWFYLTLNEAVFAENVLANLKPTKPLLEVEGIQNEQSVQIGFLMPYQISDFEIFHSSSNRIFLIHIWNKLDHQKMIDIKNSENQNNNKIFSLPKNDLKGKPFYDSFIYAREKYGPEKYFVWYNNWYSTEDSLEEKIKKTEKVENLNIWKNHWTGDIKSENILKEEYGPTMPKENEETIPNEIESKKKEELYNSKVVNLKIKNETGVVKKTSDKKSLEKTLKSEKDIKSEKKKYSQKRSKKSSKDILSPNIKNQQKFINKESSEDLAAYSIMPNLDKRKTYLKIGCDMSNVYVFLDGKRIGKTPLNKKVQVSAGWHRIRIDIPGAKKFNKSGIPTPDFRDVYVTKGRTQKVTFKVLGKNDESG